MLGEQKIEGTYGKPSTCAFTTWVLSKTTPNSSHLGRPPTDSMSPESHENYKLHMESGE